MKKYTTHTLDHGRYVIMYDNEYNEITSIHELDDDGKYVPCRIYTKTPHHDTWDIRNQSYPITLNQLRVAYAKGRVLIEPIRG